MNIDFGTSTRSTIGVEWELGLIDLESRSLAPDAPELIEQLQRTHPELAPNLSTELKLNTLEIVSGVHHTVDSLTGEMARLSRLVANEAGRRDLGVFCAGTHPWEIAADQASTPSERYDRLLEHTQWWGRQMQIFGVHVHVGIDARAKVTPILNGILRYYPHLLALSAASPWWDGLDTGYASNRTMMFQQLPYAGLPPHLDNWDTYEEVVTDYIETRVASQPNEVRWDVRPSPAFGTIELRICDGVPTLSELAALTALSQCLVDELNAEVSAGRTPLELKPWITRENKWRAARFGLDTDFIIDGTNREQNAIEAIDELAERLAPTATRLGCGPELAAVSELAHTGASYQRQRTVATHANGDLNAVVDSLVAEFEAGRPL